MSYSDAGIEPIDFGDDLWWVFYLAKPMGLETRQPLLDAFRLLNIEVAGEYRSDPYYQVILQEGENYFEVSNGEEITAHVMLGMKAGEFLPANAPTARLNADRFLEFGKICYHVLQPIYAFAETLNTYVERETVEAGLVTNVFWAQFFGPDLIQKIGRDMLLQAPAWRNENMSDGGILYVLGATPYLTHGPRQRWSEAKRYFNQHLPQSIEWLRGTPG